MLLLQHFFGTQKSEHRRDCEKETSAVSSVVRKLKIKSPQTTAREAVPTRNGKGGGHPPREQQIPVWDKEGCGDKKGL